MIIKQNCSELSSGIYCRVKLLSTDVSDVRTAYFLIVEAVRASETSVDNHFTRQYIPEDNSEHHTHRRENLKSHMLLDDWHSCFIISRSCIWLSTHKLTVLTHMLWFPSVFPGKCSYSIWKQGAGAPIHALSSSSFTVVIPFSVTWPMQLKITWPKINPDIREWLWREQGSPSYGL
jgi:hypothetical protein